MATIDDIARLRLPQQAGGHLRLEPERAPVGPRRGASWPVEPRSAAATPVPCSYHARAMLVEAARAAAKAPGPLHAFFMRLRAKQGHQVAALALARKLTVLV
ncbi:MAG: hypothetical protein AAGE83_06750 [Pseudomonadota bacterium]